MCGIVGAVANEDWELPSSDIIHQMCDAIRHRGPDDEGSFRTETVALAMRRLAIIDPMGGKQPIHSEDGQVSVVANGEIYNYRELRRRLEYHGHRFSSDSDIECIVHAYEEFGSDCFKELRGMFAIALWDETRQRLILARDRFGKKPLFYHETPAGLSFASELKALRCLPDFSSQLDSEAICSFMMYGYVPTPSSIFRNVRKLPPGTILIHEKGACHIQRYWRLQLSPKMDIDENRLVDMLDERLNSAVETRLVSDVPFGAFLSGGIDSSLVVAMMARHMDQPVKTFSIGFDDSALDETEDARRVAQHIGTEHYELRATTDIAERIEKIVWHLDEPLADSSALPTYLVSELAAGHVKMVLSGDGGDEMFAGYDRYRKYVQLIRLKSMGAKQVLGMMSSLTSWLPGPLQQRIARLNTRFDQQDPDDYISGVALLSPHELETLLHDNEAAGKGDRHSYRNLHTHFMARDDGIGVLDRILHGDMQTYLLDDVLAKVDRMSMANSIEVRSPLLDHLLAEFVGRIPERFKLRGMTGKYLLKKVAMRYLPEATINKRKQGFAIPLERWMRYDLRSMLMDTLLSESFIGRGIFNAPRVIKLAEEHISGNANHAETLWSILVFELWARQFLKPVPVLQDTSPSYFRSGETIGRDWRPEAGRA